MIRTLVVDDDFMTASIHAGYVERVEGFEAVGEAHTGLEAIRMAEALRPDLLLLDIYLPDMSGLDLVRDLRQERGVLANVIAITAAKDIRTVRAAMQAGVVNYIVKPFSYATIRERLERYRELHARLSGVREADQEEVDRLWGLLRVPNRHSLPKGISPGTLKLVREALEESPDNASLDDVVRRTGVGAATARRYLEYLRRLGTVEVQPHYGRTGRPSHRYRLVRSC